MVTVPPPSDSTTFATTPSESDDDGTAEEAKKKTKMEDTGEVVYYSGFLIDLLQEIKKEYELKGKVFPKYRITMSRLFGPPREKKEDPNDSRGPPGTSGEFFYIVLTGYSSMTENDFNELQVDSGLARC
jgi:hypothetical protein